MTWRGVWDGEWDGTWFGDEAAPGSISGTAAIRLTASGTLAATSSESREFVGSFGNARTSREGRRRRVPVRQLEPEWQREHENDAALIAAGII